MNAPHDLQPEPCRFVASNDDPATPMGRGWLVWLLADLIVVVLGLGAWAAFGLGVAWWVAK